MRTALSALILAALILISSATAQTHRTDHAAPSSGASRTFANGSPSTHSGSTSTSAPIHQAITPPPASRDHHEHPHHNRRVWGRPYTYGYGVDYSASNSEQQNAANKEYAEESARNEQDRLDDQRRERELDRQLADQRAADAAQPSIRHVSTSSPAPTEHEPTVLIFKDQSRTEVLNYAVVGNMIYDFSPQRMRKIAIADLDLPATIAANQQRGVEFSLPAPSR